MTAADAAPVPPKRIRAAAAFGFGLVHVAALGVFAAGFSWKGVLLCLGSYYLRMFAITAGFHRYFAHRTFKLDRVSQFLLAFLGQTSAQKGVLWWAAHHRHHHRWSDSPQDIHSPKQRGFWWSHMGWILSPDYEETNLKAIPDLVKHRELVWLNENMYLPTMLYGFGMWLAFGWTGLFWGYFLSTVLLWHGTFSINSVMHVFGRKVFETTDTSRNSFVMALVTMGEGWHNNHHYYQSSASQGFRWWQVDPSHYLIWAGERIGIVRDRRRVPARLREPGAPAAERIRIARERLDELTRSAVAAAAAAGGRWSEQVDALAVRWVALKGEARLRGNQAFLELEASRNRAAERLVALHAEYAAAAGRRSDELQAEVDAARAQFAEAMERLVTFAESVRSGEPSLA
jgi:stearoyl-CoA desaturase (delta-9 desaturase)